MNEHDGIIAVIIGAALTFFAWLTKKVTGNVSRDEFNNTIGALRKEIQESESGISKQIEEVNKRLDQILLHLAKNHDQ